MRFTPRGAVIFLCVFFSFSLLCFHTSQLFCFIYFVLPLLLFLLSLSFFPLELLEGKIKCPSVPSLSGHLSKAPSFLLVIVPPLEALLAFLHFGTLQKEMKRCNLEAPWPFVLWIWSALSSLISFSVCLPGSSLFNPICFHTFQ